MAKGDIKIKKDISYEAQLSPDKRTFVIRIESDQPMTWYDSILRANFWTKDEIQRLFSAERKNPTEH